LLSPQKGHSSDDSSWYSTLRDGNHSPVSKVASSVKSGPLTIPQSPNFQPIRQRPLPKSTAEKELEEMEYFNNHPFRARAVKMNSLPPESLRSKLLNRPLTTPEPFHLRTDDRGGRKRHYDEKLERDILTQFKARPMPDFGCYNAASDTGRPVSSPKPLTTPEPFHFHLTGKGAAYTPANQQQEQPTTVRTIPTGASGIRFQHKSPGWTPNTRGTRTTVASGAKNKFFTQPEFKPFKANPMPDFVPKTIHVSRRIGDMSEEVVSGNAAARRFSEHRRHVTFISPPETEVKAFKARPMPKFDSVTIPVQSRDSSKIRTPPSNFDEREISPSQFHARPVPKSLTKEPSIPVRRRNPNKLRSPDSVKRPDQSPPEDEVPSFRALPIPQSVLAEPKIPVKFRSHTKLQSPPDPPYDSQLQSAYMDVERQLFARQHDPTKLQTSPTSPDERLTPHRNATLFSPADRVATDRDDAKARLRQRLVLKNATKRLEREESKPPGTMTSPEAFTASRVKDRLSRGASEAQMKKATRSAYSEYSRTTRPGDLPGTITLPLKSPNKQISSPVKRTPPKDILDASITTPRATNARNSYPDSITGEVMSDAAATSLPDISSDAAAASGSLIQIVDADFQRKGDLACTLTEPDVDESSSILQLAREVQQAAEDELSFHGSLHSSMDPRGNYCFGVMH
jgi:hypothetical protein